MGTFVSGPIGACLTDPSGHAISTGNPIPVNPAESGAPNHAENQVSVAASATQIVSTRATRRGVIIKNTDASATIYLGGATVTTSTGHALAAGEAITIPTTIAVYGIVASSTATATYLEVYD